MRNRDTAVPAEGNGDLQTLICVLVARPRRCLTLSNPVPWQNWMAAYLGYTLQMKTLFCGWPVTVDDIHTRRRRRWFTKIRAVLTGRSTVSGFDLVWFSYLSSKRLCVFGLHGAIYIFNFVCLHPSLYLLVHWAWWDWPLTWLTNRCPSVLWHCWLGHVTRKIVPEMTYNVLNGTLNTTIPHSDSVVKMVLYWVVSVGVCVCFSILEPFEMSPWIFYSSKIRS